MIVTEAARGLVLSWRTARSPVGSTERGKIGRLPSV